MGLAEQIDFFFQAEDGIRDRDVTGVRRVLFRSLGFKPGVVPDVRRFRPKPSPSLARRLSWGSCVVRRFICVSPAPHSLRRSPHAVRASLKLHTGCPKTPSVSLQLGSSVVSLKAEAPSSPSPSLRLPGVSAYAVPQIFSDPGSSALRLHVPYRVHQPPAAQSLSTPRARPEGRTPNARRNRAPLARSSSPSCASPASPVPTRLATPRHLPPMTFLRPSTAYSSLHRSEERRGRERV